MTIYLLKDAAGNLLSFGETPFVASGGQSVDEVAGTLSDYASRFRLSADTLTIAADGVDEATVTVHTNLDPPPANIDVAVNGVPQTVSITAGQGTLTPIVASPPGEIVVEPDDRTQFSAAGEGSLVITAEAVA